MRENTQTPETCRTFRCPTPTSCAGQGYCTARGRPPDEATGERWRREAFDERMRTIEMRTLLPLLAYGNA